jgi:hypothetical protein
MTNLGGFAAHASRQSYYDINFQLAVNSLPSYGIMNLPHYSGP